jgi:hypothetical protein
MVASLKASAWPPRRQRPATAQLLGLLTHLATLTRNTIHAGTATFD